LGNSRSTVQVWTFLGRGVDHSTHALSTLPIVAERAIYLNHGFTSLGIVNGGDTVVGESSPRARWDFAEGTTLDGFQEYLTLQNPNATATVATLTFGTESSPGVPGPVVTRSVSLAATSRTTIDVNSPTEGIGTGVLGHATRVTSDLPILAERPLYFNRVIEGTLINGATVAFGTAPSPSVFLGEGNVLPSWFEFLTVANPDTANDATVDITYFFEGGQAPIVKTVSVPKAGRRTIQVFNTSDPGGVGRNVSDPLSRGVSAQVSTTSAQGVVVERPLYFDALIDKGLTVNEGTDKPGPAGPAASWYFAEGTSLPDFLTFFTISNPNLSTASVTATYLTNLGEVVPRSFTIPAASRLTIQVYNPAQIPSGALGLEREGFATTFVSDRPIVVERPIYEVHVFPDIDTPIAGGQLVVGRAG
jgi:hypothetical protein